MEQKQIAGPVRAERWNSNRQCFEHTETLLEALGIADWKMLPRVISIVGAGGKTSTMYDLAEELAKKGARVLMTTSTHIAKPDQYKVAVVPKLLDLDAWMQGRDSAAVRRNMADAGIRAGEGQNTDGSILAAGKQAEGPNSAWKLAMPEDLGEEAVMKKLLTQFDVILIEADGSKRLPLKVPSETEPVLIPQTGLVIACAGLTAGGKQFGDTCFRFASHGGWLHRNAEDVIAAEDMALILMDERGSHKGVDGRYYRVLLNQADTETEQKLAEEIAGMLPLNLQAGCVRTARMR
ncbi:selenium cofactor biosynthesis protein YqeC [Ventrimonas sp. CLA-AP-H27]|uniref:Selenium cofactor biosynthesis protein YqeC n=1 Tax=Ventrimonas faecis TaxID=3133170 RepID=A0ABV1HPY9_9FIRM